MKLLSLLIPFYLALPSNSLSIIFPLYLYPGENAAAWGDVTSTIEAYPGVQWQIIVNPNTGPGTTSYPTDPNIIAGIAKLNSYPNVNTVGYVETYHASRDISLVNADTDVYASWAHYNGGGNIALGGIYFDDVAIEDGHFSYYAAVTEHARSSFNASSSEAKVVFNPGYRAPAQLFAYADTIVEFEDSLANYRTQGIIDQIPTGLRRQSALQIYNTPEGSDVAGLIGTMAAAGIEAVYFGQDRDYKVYNKGLLQGMAGAVGGQKVATNGAVGGQKVATNGTGIHS